MTVMMGSVEHAVETLNRWHEDYRWKQAEARGDDLSLLADEFRWAREEGSACQRLSIRDLADICDDDTIQIVKRHISRISRQINPFLDDVRVIKSSQYDLCVENLLIWLTTLQYGADALIRRRGVLKSILAAASVKQAQEIGKKDGIERITEVDVQLALKVSIESLYQWERPRRISGRFSACCPFHTEKTGSFFIFKDNKFRCFGCGEHGDAIDFVMKQSGLEFVEAVKYLTKL